jgi:low affinity Fe/Cu permease
MSEIQKYAGYNVLARKALMAGIPILTLIIFLCLITVTAIGGLLIFGDERTLIIPTILSFMLFAVKVACTDDSRAMDKLAWDIRGMFYRLRCQSKIVSFTSTDTSEKRRKKNVHEWFKNNLNH